MADREPEGRVALVTGGGSGQGRATARALATMAADIVLGSCDAAWDKVIDINLTGTYRMVKRCLPGMMELGWGRIVIMASTAANVGEPSYGAYCASRAGVLGLMRCTALEGAPMA